MADFGKLNFSVAFNPTSAFPLDARCYFNSLALAKAAAATAVEVGRSDSVYYYGQKLLVDDGTSSKWYIIQRDRTLVEEGAVKPDGQTLLLENGILKVNTTNKVEQDNTLPITSAGVHTCVGNIEVLLDTI